jgi:hypothetical protein
MGLKIENFTDDWLGGNEARAALAAPRLVLFRRGAQYVGGCRAAIRRALEQAGIEFLDENGGLGVCASRVGANRKAARVGDLMGPNQKRTCRPVSGDLEWTALQSSPRESG